MVTQEALTIECFKGSTKPFVTFSVGCIVFEFAFTVIFSVTQIEMMGFLGLHMATLFFQLYLHGSDNQVSVNFLVRC